MHEARFYEPFKGKIVKCTLCPHLCLVQDGKVGACAIRKNIGGKLYSLVYGKAISYAIDPIEKKPLFHFYPGSKIFSYATAGCNFRCSFCQNWQISQISKGKDGHLEGEELTPKEVVQMAIGTGCKCIAMTYNEPSIQYEYAYDVCVEARSKGLKTVFVSNGYICEEPIKKLSRHLDAINIDIKSFDDEFYKKICGARLQPVLDAVKSYYERKVWVEITTLIIPGENDSDDELGKIANFIASIDKDIPWHISRFHPDYEMMEKEMTPIQTLEKAYNIGMEAGLRYIYIGNVQNKLHENTICKRCNETLIQRRWFRVININLLEGRCIKCKTKLPGIF